MNTGTKISIAFLVGIFLGVAGTGIYIHHCFSRAWVNSGNHKHALDMLSSKLGLTDDQKSKIEKIFDDSAPAMETVRLDTNAKLKVIRDNTAAQIRAVLTADQQSKFDALKAKWDKKISENSRGWNIPGLHSPSPNIPGLVCSPKPKGSSPVSQ